MSFDDNSSLESTTKEKLFQRWFRSRDLLIRSQGQVRFIRLTPLRQMSAVALVSTTMLWTIGSSVTSFIQSDKIKEQNALIVEAAVSQQEIRKDLNFFQNELARISSLVRHSTFATNELQSNNLSLTQELVAFEAFAQKVSGQLENAIIDIPVMAGERKTIVSSREDLKNQILDLNRDIQLSQASITKLKAELDKARGFQEALDAKNDSLKGNKEVLEQQVKSLTVALTHLREEKRNHTDLLDEAHALIANLENENGNLRDVRAKLDIALDLSDAANEKLHDTQAYIMSQITELDNMANQALANLSLYENEATDSSGRQDVDVKKILADLNKKTNIALKILGEYQDNIAENDTILSKINDRLVDIAGNVKISELNKLGETEKAKLLINDVELIQKSQLDIVAELTERTEQAITVTQETLKTTGINIETALKLAGFASGVGGPLNEIDVTDIVESETLGASIANLEYKMNHLRALDRLAGCVPLISPLDNYHVTSSFGKRKDPFTGKQAMHKGIDLGGWPGSNIYATAGGQVTKAHRSKSYGKMVEIDHGCGVTTIYGHLKKISVKKGQKISHRTVIGKLGSTGRSTGPHVHYEVRLNGKPLNPAKFIEAGKFAYKGS